MNRPLAALAFFLLFAQGAARAAARQNPLPALPARLTMNEDAGRGGWLLVTARLEDGQEALLVLDTGASDTLFDKSLEPSLKGHKGSVVVGAWAGNQLAELYEMPKVYLGNVRLMIDGPAATVDLKAFSAIIGRNVSGVLGMNCLRHYCIQLDFTGGAIRFLDGVITNKSEWGAPWAMTNYSGTDARPSIAGNVAGGKSGRSIIDTGDNSDGWLKPRDFREWTNQAASGPDIQAHSPDGKFGGELYSGLGLREVNVPMDGVGLRFLARHLVTLDFPGHTLYLKRISADPLASRGVAELLDYLKELKARGQLPGWSKENPGSAKKSTLDSPFNGGTVELQKTGDPSIYHYIVKRASKQSAWKLEKAWRSDPSNHVTEDFTVK